MIQEAHLHLLSGEDGLGEDRQAVDFRPPPGLGAAPAFTMYIDNLCVVGTTAESVNAVLDRGVGAWRRAGLGVHEVERAAHLVEDEGAKVALALALGGVSLLEVGGGGEGGARGAL